MIEPPDIPIEALVERTRDAFGVPVTTATFLPEGNDSSAWSFRVSEGTNRWFLKVFGRPVDAASVEVPRFLSSRGVPHLVPSVPTVSGRAFDEGGSFSLVLFPFFDGEPGGEVGLTQAQRSGLGRLLRQIHETPPSEDVEWIIRHERFVPRDADLLEGIATAIGNMTPPDEIARAFARTWLEHLSEIQHSLDRARALAMVASARSTERVICHADFHAWNVLIDPSGDFVVVDWDETVLAPRERDLMFVSGDIADLDPEGTAFYEGYGAVDIDPVLVAYYRFDWVLQELADYHRRVFDLDLGTRTRAQALTLFTELFGPQDVVAAAFRADRLAGDARS